MGNNNRFSEIIADLFTPQHCVAEKHHLIHSTVVWECRHSGPQWKKPLYPPKPTLLYWMALRETAEVNLSWEAAHSFLAKWK